MYKLCFDKELSSMQTTIQKWGNSKGIRIPKKILEDLNFKENDIVEIKKSNGHILIKKAVKEILSLNDLFQGYNDDYKCSEYDFGEDVGSERT